jgi:hypothetical protein
MAVKPAANIEECPFAPDFDELPADELESIVGAGEEVEEIARLLAKTEDNIVGELIKDAGTFYEWNHYPDGDVYDAETGSQFFYHAHPADLRVGEHGHFHTFLRPSGMPEGMQPVDLSDLTMPEDENDALSHLIGISMDEWGKPICLFTTNRWVTGEIWYEAGDVIPMLKLFEIGHTQPSWPVNRWVSAMVRFYGLEIAALVAERDATVEAWQNRPLPIDEETGKPVTSVFENRELEVTSYLQISLADRLERARACLGRS